ncbi:helix-turn-helix domain-containing protein [Microbacterium sp. HD4P20]|uniref:helix-turn-helix transcriptional regulator n=1 Tax=Microbacterium sp. HD4P20 TaxID=2864874 RepID=UPI001C6433B8|nr:helix-turn-helix domain-containing protein [Microbacterium sp. HD4P20]MCP2636767.1 helix-turn-helix domain-containing protein [Microbacterium sp. HD4P20]
MTTRNRMPRLLTPAEVADILGVEPRTLQRWRDKNTGPASVRLSHRTVRYPLDDLIRYLNDSREAV